MTRLYNILSDLLGADKVAYYQFPIDEAPALPYCVYYQTGADNFAADNIVYYDRKNITVEYYSELRDTAGEAALEAALTDAEIYYTKSITYIDGERLFMTIYEMEL